MTQKNRVQVVIDGQVLTMGGYEDEMHIQKVANCVNRAIQEIKGTNSYRGLPSSLKPLLVQLNIADELVKAEKRIQQLEEDIRMKDDELAEVKQSYIDLQMKKQQ